MVFVIVIIHELGHAVVANHFGWRIHKIKLLPFGGVAEVDEYGNRPLKEEVSVLIGGPIQHLWLPFFSLFLLHFPFWQKADHTLFLQKNWMILYFNLLPIWPLDGGKLIRVLLSKYLPFKKAHVISLTLSFFFLIIFIIVGAIVMPTSPNFWAIILFIIVTHYKEWKQHQYVFMRFLLERWNLDSKKRVAIKSLFVQSDTTINDVLNMFYKGFLHRVVIISNGKRLSIDEAALLDYYFTNNGGNHAIGDVFR